MSELGLIAWLVCSLPVAMLIGDCALSETWGAVCRI